MEALRSSLEGRGYTLLSVFGFNELMIPLREGLQSRNGYSLALWGFFMLGLAICGGFAGYWLKTGQIGGGPLALYMLLGIPAVLLLVPLHEWIHGLFFKCYGANDVRYGAIWRKLMFYAVAHAFVVNLRQFRMIAMAPFVLISLLLALVFVFVPVEWKALLLGVFTFHTLCCAGDFGLCAYFYKYKHRQPLSFDDANTGETYFYALPEKPLTETITSDEENP